MHLRRLVALSGDDDELCRGWRARSARRIASRRSAILRYFVAPGGDETRLDFARGSPAGSSVRGIVGRRDRDVRQPPRDLAHRRPLAAVAVSAAAEDEDDLLVRQLPHRLEQPLERVGRVGVVHEDRVGLARLDRSSRPGTLRHLADRGGDVAGGIRRQRPAVAAAGRFASWKRPSSGEATGRRPPGMDEIERDAREIAARRLGTELRARRRTREKLASGGAASARSRRPYGSSALTTPHAPGLAQVEEASSSPRSRTPCRRGSRDDRASGS